MENDQVVAFKIALSVSFLMFLISLAILVWMATAFTGELSITQDTLRIAADSLWKASAGVMFGLVSGRSLS